MIRVNQETTGNSGTGLRDSAPTALLTEIERQQILVEWNQTEAEFPHDRCIHNLFEDQAARAPDAVAVVHEDRRLCYGELNARANWLAHYLRGLGVSPDARVAIGLERSIELVVAQLAILKCGAAYVPLEQSAPPLRQAFIIKDCQAQIVVTGQGRVVPETPGLRRVDVDELPMTGQAAPNPAAPMGSEATAHVMYTSGSTGQPKGVLIPHRAVGRLVLNNGYADFQASDRVAFAANPAFDAATMEVWAPLLNGGCIVVIEQAILNSPEALEQRLKRNAINVLWLTVGLFNQYADRLADAFSHLRYLIVGGDVLDPRVIGRLLQGNPPQNLINGYGPTETTTFATTYKITEVPAGATSIPIGRPISNTRVYILDGHGEPVPVGVAGEIHIGGAGVARGYLNRPELTAERFVADPFAGAADARMYKSGDLGRYLPDGNIEFLGRNDLQVKIRGFRVEPGEIGAALVRHPAVREAVVLAHEDDIGGKRLVAYYTMLPHWVAEPGAAEAGARALRHHLEAVLPEYMVPTAYVRLDAMPLTANGKLDRQALPAPDGAAYGARRYEAPVGDIETCVARIWAEVLGLECVGRHDDFFELGGHSLLAVRVIELLNRQLGWTLELAALFGQPTVAGLAHLGLASEQMAPTRISDHLEVLRAGRDQPPVVCVGWTHPVESLLKGLPADTPVWWLKVDSQDARPYVRSIPQMSKAFSSELIRAIPSGPFVLVGFSFGGSIAFDLAGRFHREGRLVQAILLEPSHSLDFQTSPETLAEPFLPWVRTRVLHHLKILQQKTLPERLKYLVGRIGVWSGGMYGMCRKTLIQPYIRLQLALNQYVPPPNRYVFFERQIGSRIKSYQPVPCPGSIWLAGRAEYLEQRGDAWRSLVDGKVHYVVVEAPTHEDVTALPAAEAWLAILRDRKGAIPMFNRK